MKPAIGLILFTAFLSAGILNTLGAESKHDKDVRECRKAPPVMKHPADLKKGKQDAFNACMAGKGYAVGKIRAK